MISNTFDADHFLPEVFQKIDATIQSIFQDADAWIAKNPVNDPLNKDKKSILNRKVYKALRQLEQKIRQPGSLQQFSKMFASAVDFFDTTTIVGRGQGSIENKVFAGLINGTKTAVATLLKSSVVFSSVALGAASGAAGGAVMGLGAGATRLVSGADTHDFVKNNLMFKIDQPSAQMGKIFVNSVVTSLHNIVQVPVLISYGAVEGVVLGGLTGGELALNIGTKIKNPGLELRKNEQVAKLQNRLKSIQQDIKSLEYNKKQAELILPILDKIIQNPQDRNLQALRMRDWLLYYTELTNTELTPQEKETFSTMSKSSRLFHEDLPIGEMRASYGRSMQQAQQNLDKLQQEKDSLQAELNKIQKAPQVQRTNMNQFVKPAIIPLSASNLEQHNNLVSDQNLVLEKGPESVTSQPVARWLDVPSSDTNSVVSDSDFESVADDSEIEILSPQSKKRDLSRSSSKLVGSADSFEVGTLPAKQTLAVSRSSTRSIGGGLGSKPVVPSRAASARF